MNTVEIYTRDECEGAMCLWEYCLLQRSNDDDSVFDWMRGGEGAANARDMCIDLASDLEQSYRVAKAFGYDDCFDWDFVPRWVSIAMQITEEHTLEGPWITYLGLEAYRDWRTNEMQYI
jgi:hypothetical protein